VTKTPVGQRKYVSYPNRLDAYVLKLRSIFCYRADSFFRVGSDDDDDVDDDMDIELDPPTPQHAKEFENLIKLFRQEFQRRSTKSRGLLLESFSKWLQSKLT